MAAFRVAPKTGFVLTLFMLVVHSSVPEKADEPPHIVFPISFNPHIVGTHHRAGYRISCHASGHPPPSYQWRKNGQELSNLNDSVTEFPNGTLHFKNFSDTDNGFYQCLAKNRFGISLSVNVPIWNARPATKLRQPTTEPEKLTVQAGDPVTLTCGDTPATVPQWNRRWYHSNGAKDVRADERISTDAEGNLRFALVKSQDAGHYSCGLVPPVLKPHEVIIMYKSVELIVETRTVESKKPLYVAYSSGKMVKGFLGRDITLECIFSGSAPINITWRRGGYPVTQFSNGKKLRVDDFGRQLTISQLVDEDEGEYVCEGHDGFDHSQEIIFVNVTSPPYKVQYRGLVNTIIPEGRDIVLRCEAKAAHGENLRAPVWYRDGQVISNANLPHPERYIFNADYTQLQIINTDTEKDTACFQCNVSNSEGHVFYDTYVKVIESIKIRKRPDHVNSISRTEVVDVTVLASGDRCCTLSTSWFLNGARLTQADLSNPPFRRGSNDTLLFDPTNVTNEILSSRTGRFLCNVSSIYDYKEIEFSIIIREDEKPEALVAVNSGGLQLWVILLLCGVFIILIAAVVSLVAVKRNFPRQSYPLERTEIRHQLNPKQDLLDQSFQEI